jgi:hypothetical protein
MFSPDIAPKMLQNFRIRAEVGGNIHEAPALEETRAGAMAPCSPVLLPLFSSH